MGEYTATPFVVPFPRLVCIMRLCFRSVVGSFLAACLMVGSAVADDSVSVAASKKTASSASSSGGVRMGNGSMVFETVPGWGLRPDGASAIGASHGAVVIDKAGNIFTSSSRGVYVFTPEGQVVQSYLDPEFSNFHDMEIREEDGQEYIYAAVNDGAKGLKFNAHSGEIVLRLPYPPESGLGEIPFNPTAITVDPDGNIYLSNGYATNHIFKYDKDGKYIMHFGEKGNEKKQFNTAHGMTLDTRYDPPRLLICDRNHQPRGRLVHYDLDGQFIEEIVSDLGMPTSASIQGEYVSVPDLQGRVAIINGKHQVVAVLGHNPDPKTSGNYYVPVSQWIDGVLTGSHGSYWDADGSLYVQDWNVDGRMTKFQRVK